MPRPPRVFAAGAVYHVYNRMAGGAPVFAEGAAAESLIEILAEVKRRDDWTVYAWCVMPTHFHVVLRSGEPPLSRGLHNVQSRFSRRYNRDVGRKGPLWQGRYQAKLVADEKYLDQLIVYVHLNPVRASLVGSPERYQYSGHNELMEHGEAWGLVDVDQALGCFAERSREAVRNYRSACTSALAANGRVASSTKEPAGAVAARGLWFPTGTPYLDILGRSSAPERPRATADQFLAAACELLDIEPGRLASPVRDADTVRARRLLSSLGVELWDIRTRGLAALLGRLPEVVSRWAGAGIHLRLEDEAFRTAYEELDAALQRKLADTGAVE